MQISTNWLFNHKAPEAEGDLQNKILSRMTLEECNHSHIKIKQDQSSNVSLYGRAKRISNTEQFSSQYIIYKISSSCRVIIPIQNSKATSTGVAALQCPATLPPKTQPSIPASDTLRAPFQVCRPAHSGSTYEPDSDKISNGPCILVIRAKLHIKKKKKACS